MPARACSQFGQGRRISHTSSARTEGISSISDLDHRAGLRERTPHGSSLLLGALTGHELTDTTIDLPGLVATEAAARRAAQRRIGPESAHRQTDDALRVLRHENS